jgi:nucleotide-binding universal stress UspA family protein
VAVDHALGLARALDLAVCLLCVDAGRVRSSLSSVTSEAKNTLALAEARAAAAGVTYEAHLGYGSIAETIREAATSRACDAIVLGSRGLTGFKRLMLGSISNAVTAKTLLPVLIVKRFFLA